MRGDLRPAGGAGHLLLVLDDGTTPDERAVAHRWWGSIIDALSVQGLRVSIATTGAVTAWHASLNAAGVEAIALRRRWRTDVVTPVPALRDYLRTRQPQLIYAHEALPTVIAGTAARLSGYGKPCLYHRHHTYSSLQHELASRLAARLATRTVVFSRAVACAAQRWDGTAPSDIRTVTPGIPEPRVVAEDEIGDTRSRLGIGQPDVVVVVVARLRPEKGIKTLLDAMHLVSTEQPVHAVVVGAGPEGSSLRAHANQLPGSVRFVGHQDDVPLWYAMADVVAIPSLREPLGLVALEALASARPVVASGVDGLAETLTHEVDALLHEPGDAQQLARHLQDLSQSRARRRVLGAAGRRTYERSYTMAKMAESIKKLVADELRLVDGRERR